VERATADSRWSLGDDVTREMADDAERGHGQEA
jgi:hypothetical protein